jgi:HEAT repeat protein
MKRPNVSARILRNLAHPDASRRRAAAEALACGDERAVYPLIQAMRDAHPGVQDAAMQSLVSIGGEVTAWMVLPLLRDEAYLRNTAMLILKEIGRAAVRHLPPLLKDKDDDVRKFAIELIADAGALELSAELSGRLTDDPNPNVRAAAGKALGSLGCREAVPLLVAALRDIEWVRFSALEALAGLRAEEAVSPILALLSDPSPATRRAAIEALGAIGSPGAVDALVDHLGNADRDERAVALMGILRIGARLPGAGYPEELLEIFLGDEEWPDRLVALRGLMGSARGDALRTIFDVAGSLDETNPSQEEVLRAIKGILPGCGHPEALPGLLSDPALRFRGKAILAEIIGELRIREAVPVLGERLREDVRDVRRAAASALGRIGDDAALSALLAAIGDADGHVRKAVVAALGTVGRKEAFAPLLALLKAEKYDDVIEEAVLALSAIDPAALSAAGGGLEGRALELFGAFERGELRNGSPESAEQDVWA